MLRLYVPGLKRGFGSRGFHCSSAKLLYKSASASPSPTQPTPPETPANNSGSGSGDEHKYDKHPILRRVPRLLRPYTTRFITAPVSHVTAFVLLHEITAVMPLIGIWYVLHQYHDALMVLALDFPALAMEEGTRIIDKATRGYNFGTYSIAEKIQFVKEGAFAYVIVKSLFPVRLAISLLGMPWFARRLVLPVTKMFSRKKAAPVSTATVIGAPHIAIKQHHITKIDKPRL